MKQKFMSLSLIGLLIGIASLLVGLFFGIVGLEKNKEQTFQELLNEYAVEMVPLANPENLEVTITIMEVIK